MNQILQREGQRVVSKGGELELLEKGRQLQDTELKQLLFAKKIANG